MRVLFVSSEVYPLAKTGGLADVSHALPLALRNLGVDIRLLMPGYPQALDRAERTGPTLPLGAVMGFDGVSLVRAELPGSHLPIWLIDCPSLFVRQGGLYCDGAGQDWPDNHVRFALFAHVGAHLAASLAPVRWRPDVVHANDWHTGLLPMFLKHWQKRAAPTLFAIHNMAFQGAFAMEIAGRIGLAPQHLTTQAAEYYGKISYLKAGIGFADKLATVSPTYAREITTPEFGFGLEGLVSARAGDLEGIPNGVDYGIWDPAHDPLISARYSASNFVGKRICKAALQQELGLSVDPEVPIFAYASRLTEQKMADQVLAIAPQIIERHGQLAFVAQGECRFEEGFAELARRWPGRIGGQIGYNEVAAHRLIAGADILLAPARFEPCGLTQLYAMRYGTIPIVCPTGGLVDTVVDATPQTVKARVATGFHTRRADADGLREVISRAEALRREPLAWRRLCETAMAQDFSWDRSARRYIALYRQMAYPETAVAKETPARTAAVVEH